MGRNACIPKGVGRNATSKTKSDSSNLCALTWKYSKCNSSIKTYVIFDYYGLPKHTLPLTTVVGAALYEKGCKVYSQRVLEMTISSFVFG
jgi:hypothetical protein